MVLGTYSNVLKNNTMTKKIAQKIVTVKAREIHEKYTA